MMSTLSQLPYSALLDLNSKKLCSQYLNAKIQEAQTQESTSQKHKFDSFHASPQRKHPPVMQIIHQAYNQHFQLLYMLAVKINALGDQYNLLLQGLSQKIMDQIF